MTGRMRRRRRRRCPRGGGQRAHQRKRKDRRSDKGPHDDHNEQVTPAVTEERRRPAVPTRRRPSSSSLDKQPTTIDDGPMASISAWERWEDLRAGADPDPIEVLNAVTSFQEYFAAVEKEAIKVARAQGHSWQEIGAALGRTRQALWQRAGSPHGKDLTDATWEEFRKEMAASWATVAEVRFSIGLPPPS